MFPNWSSLITPGCNPNTDPAVALPGWVVNASLATAAGLIEIAVDVVLVRLPLVNRIVIVFATLWDKLV